MKTFLPTLTTLTLAIFIAGCGGSYKQGNWAHTSEEADWDIDSAVCLAHSETPLTEDELETIEEIKRNREEAADVVSTQADILGSAGYDNTYFNYASGLFGAYSGAKNATAEETYKEQKFSECLEGKGWAE